MQSEPGRYINSVSDLLYSTDEIEFLLDDIRDLEPTSCKPEDIQVHRLRRHNFCMALWSCFTFIVASFCFVVFGFVE